MICAGVPWVAGIPERVAISLTSHKSRSAFDRYNIVSERDLSEGVAKLAALHRGGTVMGTASHQHPDDVGVLEAVLEPRRLREGSAS